jgi:diguanylate cyclase (GGDEF)-like protein
MPDEQINPETGLYTRSRIEFLLSNEVTRAQHYPTPLTLLRLALHSPINNYPRDLAHSTIANLLNTLLRATDTPGHFDDDYLVLLSATHHIGGLIVASRLVDRAKILHSADEGHRDQFDLAVCIGVSEHPGGSAMSAIELLRQATIALDEAKRRGPHSIVSFTDLPS